MKIEIAARRQNVLGEGPLWDPDAGRLYWADIRSRRIEWIEPPTGACGRYEVPVRASALSRTEGGRLLVAGDHCIGLLDLQGGAFEPRVTFEHNLPSNRANDGKLIGDGRFLFGTMDDEARPGRGALYALSSDWSLTPLKEGLGIPNGIVGTEDGKQLFLADSLDQLIWRHELRSDGSLGERRLHFSAVGGRHTPDGAALDREGCLWSAQWDGGRVMRIAPDGSVDRAVDLPVTRPTACAFGGPNLKTLFVTSARDGLSAEQLAREPLAGSVFMVDVDVEGVQLGAFAA